ncbi:glycosyltransferase [Acetobacter estunensis NRIC 0472]|uniref:Glycosyltransferase n=1 Tax=Acetobacter estunensis TaxID=104097 RepID=A0A967B978_9PROT|nr:glycosyltransferase family A protein [Acetobacter estunensis]NHO54461.1 glycosyltransferase [Acetobacter estunensis]GBQ21982.1 glycosyltransferase [Acetobacter estunensis NRIC 0472]
MSEIDVLMSVYNCESYILETLQSIQGQSIQDIRIIIVDDGSTDQTAKIIQKEAENDPRIFYFYQKNAGIVSALTTGLQYCSAPFIARHDGDDISHPLRFEKELTYLKENEDCVAVSCYIDLIDEKGHAIPRAPYTYPLDTTDPYSFPAVEPYISQPFLMLRADSLHAIGGYRYLRSSEDTDLYWRLRAVGRLHVLPEVLGTYRIHGNSTTSGSKKNMRQSAVWSQLAAISEQRRLNNYADNSFTHDFMTTLSEAENWRDILDRAGQQLTENEKKWLQTACAAKFLELCKMRATSASKEDLIFIRTALADNPAISEGAIMEMTRLWNSGQRREAILMAIALKQPKLAARATIRNLKKSLTS